jgi:hypothetical protein
VVNDRHFDRAKWNRFLIVHVLFFVVIFSRHISNLNFRKDTFLNANSYSTLTILNYPHSLQNGLTSKAVNPRKWANKMVQFLFNSMYVLGLSWGHCALSYILKYIPANVRMDWPSITTRQTHTNNPTFFATLFADIAYVHNSNIPAFGGTRSPRGRVSFSGGICMQMTCGSKKTLIKPKIYHSGRNYFINTCFYIQVQIQIWIYFLIVSDTSIGWYDTVITKK